ncbi:MAG: hypothetical protein IJP05_01630 [Oscillospiraceae bacterium]|nr:hypothetical protein [Oscillospiraceae bacterium]
MYSFKEREQLMNSIIFFLEEKPFFEGLVQIGSGAFGFADIYSDIDFMAGCYDAECVKNADAALTDFFAFLGAKHVEKRRWTNSAFGISVYFENGLSTDISFMPTDEIPIRSSPYKIVLAKTENFSSAVNSAAEKTEKQPKNYGIDDSIHYRFINELRYAEIALLRKNYTFADISLNNARQLLLAAEAVTEGKKLHQFKAYSTLSEDFTENLKSTYPQNLNYESISSAKENLLSLYIKTIKNSKIFTFDESLLCLINCFE